MTFFKQIIKTIDKALINITIIDFRAVWLGVYRDYAGQDHQTYILDGQHVFQWENATDCIWNLHWNACTYLLSSNPALNYALLLFIFSLSAQVTEQLPQRLSLPWYPSGSGSSQMLNSHNEMSRCMDYRQSVSLSYRSPDEAALSPQWCHLRQINSQHWPLNWCLN